MQDRPEAAVHRQEGCLEAVLHRAEEHPELTAYRIKEILKATALRAEGFHPETVCAEQEVWRLTADGVPPGHHGRITAEVRMHLKKTMLAIQKLPEFRADSVRAGAV